VKYSIQERTLLCNRFIRHSGTRWRAQCIMSSFCIAIHCQWWRLHFWRILLVASSSYYKKNWKILGTTATGDSRHSLRCLLLHRTHTYVITLHIKYKRRSITRTPNNSNLKAIKLVLDNITAFTLTDVDLLVNKVLGFVWISTDSKYWVHEIWTWWNCGWEEIDNFSSFSC
jgi:hypothetical protein